MRNVIGFSNGLLIDKKSKIHSLFKLYQTHKASLIDNDVWPEWLPISKLRLDPNHKQNSIPFDYLDKLKDAQASGIKFQCLSSK